MTVSTQASALAKELGFCQLGLSILFIVCGFIAPFLFFFAGHFLCLALINLGWHKPYGTSFPS